MSNIGVINGKGKYLARTPGELAPKAACRIRMPKKLGEKRMAGNDRVEAGGVSTESLAGLVSGNSSP
jgi:hypothetical protein